MRLGVFLIWQCVSLLLSLLLLLALVVRSALGCWWFSFVVLCDLCIHGIDSELDAQGLVVDTSLTPLLTI